MSNPDIQTKNPIGRPIRVTHYPDGFPSPDTRILEIGTSPLPLPLFIKGLVQSLDREEEKIPYGTWD